jgi:hypothetical protein
LFNYELVDLEIHRHEKNGQATKGLWWIPRHTEAKKDAITGETLRGVGSKL